jgi:hypothetical protein
MRNLGPVPVDSLLLDELNPRLPEHEQGGSQAEILAYLFEHDVLTELADSYLTNGFFPNEALLVLPPDGAGERVVVEGNRRLGALKYLLRDDTAVEAQLPTHGVDPAPTAERLDSLARVPVVELSDRDELSSYLGFRHISGLKTWAPEAKARYLYHEVEKAWEAGASDPFYLVGRQVGSNAYGVRNAYYAYNALRFARDQLDLRDLATAVMSKRFGVWTRLLGTAHVPQYIGLGQASHAYETVVASTANLDRLRVEEVLRDLTPRTNSERAVLRDSRDATDYSAVLAHEVAREVLRNTGRLDLAAEIANGSDYDNRLQRALEVLEVATREAFDGVGTTERTPQLAKAILKEARTLHALVQALSAPDSDEEE